MRLHVQREKIIDGLIKCSGILPSKAGAAYLRSIWLRADEGKLSLMSTDANIEFTGTYAADVEEPGLAGVLGRAFVDLVRKLPNGDIFLSTDDNEEHLLLEQGRRKYKLALYSKDWFQEFTSFPEGEAVSWNGGEFADYIERVYFCIGENDAMEAVNCLCIKPREHGRIDVCGLNGTQFAMVSFVYDEMAAVLPKAGLLIDKKCLSDLRKWLGENKIEVSLTEKRLHLRTSDGAETLSLPRVLVDYPDYDVFLNKLQDTGSSTLNLPRKEAMEAMGRLSVFNSEVDRCVFMRLSPTEVIMESRGSDVGSAEEHMEANYAGRLPHIAFPNRALQEIFSHFTSEQMDLVLTQEEGPCGVTGTEDVGYTVVIMPMKIANTLFYEPDEG